MAFGNKKLEKQDLIDAGFDPAMLQELKDQGVKKEDLATLKTELATSMTEQIKAGFAELETRLKPTTNNNEGGDTNKGGNDEVPEFDQFTNDPVGFVNKKTGAVLGAAALEFKRMASSLAYRSLSTTLKGFKNDALRAEIDEEWKKYTPEVLARNNADPEKLLVQIHDMIIGKHHDEIQQDTAKKEGKFNLVHSGAGSSGGTIHDNTGRDESKITLTPAEQAAAKRFGMTDEEWIKEGKDMAEEEITRHRVGV
jgi:hypothetical protein